VLDWTPTRSVETEVELELDDIDQMLEAQNERRRRRGLPDRTEDDVRADVAAHERELKDRAAAIAPRVAQLLGAELDWDAERRRREVDHFLAGARREFGVPAVVAGRGPVSD